MSRHKFKIKQKPDKPNKRDFSGNNICQCQEIGSAYEDIDAEQLIGRLQQALEIDPDAYVEVALDYSHCWYESEAPTAKLVIRWNESSDAAYNAALVAYQDKLAKYNEWYKANKKQIETELAAREVEEKARALKKAERLEREAKKIRDGLDR